MKTSMAPGWDTRVTYDTEKGTSEIILLRVNDDKSFEHARYTIAHYPDQNPLELLAPLAPYAILIVSNEE